MRRACGSTWGGSRRCSISWSSAGQSKVTSGYRCHEERGGLLPLLGLAVLPPSVDGEAERGLGLTARREPQLGVAGDVADQRDAVSVGHRLTLRSSPDPVRVVPLFGGAGASPVGDPFGKTDHLVADDLVREMQGPVELGHHRGLGPAPPRARSSRPSGGSARRRTAACPTGRPGAGRPRGRGSGRWSGRPPPGRHPPPGWSRG